MPSHGRGAYRAARAATRALNEEHTQAEKDVERLMAMWQEERDRAEKAEAELARRDAAIVAGHNEAISRQENGL